MSRASLLGGEWQRGIACARHHASHCIFESRGHSAATTSAGELLVWGRTHDVANTIRYSCDVHLQALCDVLTVLALRRFIWLQGMFPGLVKFMNYISGGSMLSSLEPSITPLLGGRDARFKRVACSPGAISLALSGTPVLSRFAPRPPPPSLSLEADTDDGELFALGSNQFGECGTGHTENNCWEWEQVLGLDDHRVVDMQVGFAHSICLTGALCDSLLSPVCHTSFVCLMLHNLVARGWNCLLLGEGRAWASGTGRQVLVQGGRPYSGAQRRVA